MRVGQWVFRGLLLVILLGSGIHPLLAQGESYWESIPEKVRERNAYKRFEWFYRQRALPDNAIPEGAIERAREVEMEKIAARGTEVMDVNWTPIGPTGIVSTFPAQWGVVSGRVRAIAVHPTDPNTAYIGVSAGGIWKTTNGGTTWLDVGANLASLTFGAVAIDPSNPNNVYAGAGESMRFFNTTTYDGKGLYKSTDAGATWTHITNGFGSRTHFSALRVSPTNSNTLYAALGSAYWHFSGPGNEGLWRSTDAGVTWTRTLNADDGFDVLPHPTTANRVYATTGGATSTAGFYVSTDNGASWTKVTTGLPAATSIDRMQIALSTSTPSTLYALNFRNSTGQMTLYKSTDDGATWASVGSAFSSGQGWYDLLLAVNPSDVNEVYIGDAELRRSTNGGTTFSYVGGSYWNQATHVDLHYMVFAPSNPTIRYVGCDGGVYKSADGGTTWVNQNGTLPTLQYYRLGSHPTNQNIMTGGAQDNGVFKTITGGTGTWTLVSTGDGMETFYDYSTPTTVYASTQSGGLIKSTTGGDYGTFSSVKPTTSDTWAWTAPFLIHPTTSSTIYTASRRPWRSTNGGSSWTDLTGAILTSVAITSMAISPADPNNLILTASEWTNSPAVYVSSNGGTGWTLVTANIGGTARYISRVVTHPTQAQTMFVVRSGFSAANKVYRTTNLGSTWTNISGDLPDVPHNDLFIDPLNVTHMYTANDLGVYRTTNDGVNWVRQGNNLPFVPAMDFDYFNSGGVRLLRVATHGRSAYQTALEVPPATPTLASPANGATSQPTTLTLTWNTASGAARYRLQVSSNAGFTALVFDDSTITGTSQQVSGLSMSTTYYWRVKAENTGGDSPYSTSRSFTTIVTVPSAPSLASPASGSTSQPTTLTLSWNTTAGAETYRLQVATDAGFTSLVVNDSTLTGTSRQVGPLNNSTIYYWRVNAKNTAGTSAYSAVWNFTTVIAPPASPTLASPPDAATNQPTTLTLSWNSAPTADTYRIQVATDAGFTTLVVNDSTVTSTSRVVGPLNNSTQYFWRVNAKNVGGTSSYSSSRGFTTIIAAPAAPALSSPPNSANNQPTTLTLSWNSVGGADTYRLEVATDAGFTALVFSDSTLTSTSQQVGPLSHLTQYYWRVNAKNVGGTSAYSSSRNFTTIIAAPVAPVLQSPADGATNQPTTLNLSWETVSGADTYRLQVATDSLFASIVHDDSTLTATSDQAGPLNHLTQYYWRVNAKNVGGTSSYSSLRSFTTIIAAPSIPVPDSPADSAVNQPLTVPLSWSPSATADTYRLQVASDAGFTSLVFDDSTLSGTSQSVGPLAHLTWYFWRVNAKNVGGTSSYSAVRAYETIIAAPAVPVLSTPADEAIHQPLALDLEWESAERAETYHLQVATDSSFSTLIVDNSAITTTTHSLSSLTPGTTYFWRVKAENVGGSSLFSGFRRFTTVTIPLQTVLVSPADSSTAKTDTVILKWLAGSPAIQRYWVEYAGNPGFSGSTIDSTATDTTMSVTALADSQSYWWRIRAGNKAGWGPFSSTRMFLTRFEVSIPLQVLLRWNLVSNPVISQSDSVHHLFPPSVTTDCIFVYQPGSGYQQRCVLEHGKGAWLKSLMDTTVSIIGSPVRQNDFPLLTGWNLIGSISSIISVTSISTTPPGILTSPFFGYSGSQGYVTSQKLTPGRGYWVKSSSAGTMHLSKGAIAGGETDIHGEPGPMVKLAVRDARGIHQTLLVVHASGDEDVDSELPPPGPAGLLDVRFQNGGWKSQAPVTGSSDHRVLIQSAEYPLTVSWEVVEGWTQSVRLHDGAGNTIFPARLLSGRGEVTLRNAPVQSLSLEVGGGEVPTAFALEQNYPNPFNPSTTLRYALPEAAFVTLKIFDPLGQEVTTLVSGFQEAGYRSVEWNARSQSGERVGSGVYFFRLQAGGFVQTRKMVLLK